MKKTISSGLMSVPVAIMSTVTAMRGIVAVAESAEDLVRREAGGALSTVTSSIFLAVGPCFLFHDANEAGAIGDLLAEVVAFAEDFAADADDVVGVGVVLGEDEGLGQIGAAREHFGKDFVAKRGEHGANLVGRDDIAIETRRPRR